MTPWPHSWTGPRPTPAVVSASLAGVSRTPFWLDSPARPSPRPPLKGDTATDLAVVGGGFSGLWTALLAKERDPGRRVLVLEGATLAWSASGRNGGFCDASLTHGRLNGQSRWPQEIDRLEELGEENLAGLADTLDRHGIDCSFRTPGSLTVAVEPHQVQELRDAAGDGATFLDAAAVRARLDSPTYLAGLASPSGTALVDPAALTWGLAEACERLGVQIVEHTPVRSLSTGRDGVRLRTDGRTVRAAHVALGTNAFPSLVRRTRLLTVPVYDHVLVTEPLTAAQLASIGWAGREGVDDAANRFHYYRLTPDDRILWGGYDALYYFGRRVDARRDARPVTEADLAAHFLTTFPQLEGIRFTHTWGGAIDTCSRFCAFYGTAGGGRVAYAAGYTGLGVGATRFGARVMLDLLDGEPTELTQLAMVRERPLPFPPEPLAWLGIQATRWSLARADEHAGRRNLLLRGLDAVGAGFDS